MDVLKRLLAVVALLYSFQLARADDFALRDGDTVVFLGDSITAARSYGKMIENYTLLRYPERKVRFINSGWGGDTAAGGLERLERDVFAHGATVLTVAYGINDIGWGMKADQEHRQQYLDSIVGIVEACKRRGVRVYICSCAPTATDPDKSDGDFLQQMCDEGMRLAREHGGHSIDVQRTMKECQRRAIKFAKDRPDSKNMAAMHAADGIHLTDLGQTAMGFAILKGFGAPTDVSSVTIDISRGKVVETAGCSVREVEFFKDQVEFLRHDEGLPLNGEAFEGLKYPFVPIPEELNRYRLTVKGLAPGKYTVTVSGMNCATFTAEQLAAGVNLASVTRDPWQPGTPWAAQARILHHLTESRDQLSLASKYSPLMLDNREPKGLSLRTTKANKQLERLQREVAKPIPYHFVIEPEQPSSSDP